MKALNVVENKVKKYSNEPYNEFYMIQEIRM